MDGIDLKVREVRLFEQHAGMSYAKALKTMGLKCCSPHRLAVKHCGECRSRPCPDHMEAVQECERCEGADIPARVAAVLVWIYRLRKDGMAGLDDVEELTYTELMTELGEGLAGTEDSTTSEKAGSPHSSTGTRGSASRGTKA